MAVQNIECQIARGQLGRYLDGEGIGAEATRQLEAHFAKCPDCREVLESKKSDLISQMPASPTKTPPPASKLGHAVVSQVSPPAPKPTAVAEVAVPTPTPKRANWKPVAYSAGLAVVLLGMSYFGKNGFELLGPKAAASLPSNATSDNPSTPPSAKPVEPGPSAPSLAPVTPLAADEALVLAATIASMPSLDGVASTATPSLQPARVGGRSALKRRPTRSTRRKPTRSKIRVYDASGAPISN